MGLGKLVNGKPTPITPYKGSWAWHEEQRRKALGAPRTSDGKAFKAEYLQALDVYYRATKSP